MRVRGTREEKTVARTAREALRDEARQCGRRGRRGRHEQHGVCDKSHFNDPAKRTRDLERARREEHIYIYIYIYIIKLMSII
jgi:hypothetical protein